ncbi:MAG: hypothetical protein Q7S26_00035 [bacterium]|nr:hypothetical protein [bacterium]
MDKNEKFLRKLSPKQRDVLQTLVEAILSGNTELLRITKLKGVDSYKVRKGDFRIVFHYGKDMAIIDRIIFRNESTYKNL